MLSSCTSLKLCFLLVLSFQLVNYVRSDNVTEDDTARKSAINICDYPGCACYDSRTVVNCSCLNTLQTGRIKEKAIKISDTSYVFPSTLKSIHLSNCDFIELFTTKGLANLNLEELSISSASGVAIKSGTLKRIANLTIKHVRSFSFEAQAFSQLESSIVHFHNVTFVRDEEVIEFRPSHIKTHLTLSESHLFGNTPIVISQDDVTGLTVNISRCHLEDLIIDIKADTVELKNNKFNTTECLIDNSPCDKERSIKFQKSLTVVDNSYKQMSMPDITFDGQNITVNMFPNMMSGHYHPATAEVAKQFLESFHLEIDRNRATGTGQCTPKEVWDSKPPQCKVICNNGNELNSYVTKKLVMQFNKCVQNIPSSRNPRRGSNSATTSLPSHIGVHLLSFLLLVAYPLVSKS